MVTPFIALLFRMKHISRWSLMRSSSPENLTEHTLECAQLVHFLAMIGNTYYGKSYSPDKLAAYALYHDAPEILTGDLPTPIKYFNPDMRRIYGEIEAAAANKLLSYLPPELTEAYAELLSGRELTESDRLLLKISDKLCAYIKCVIELNSGNNEFSKAHSALKADIEKYESPELDYFLENCMQAFTLSLDELNISF